MTYNLGMANDAKSSIHQGEAEMKGRLADLADLVLNVSQEIKMLSSAADSIPLTLTESNVMRFVDRHPGTSPSALAAGTGLQRSNMSAALKGLEEKGLIRRIRDVEDGRTVSVEPTPVAARNLSKLRDTWSVGIDRVLAEDRSQVDAALSLLRIIETGLADARQTTA